MTNKIKEYSKKINYDLWADAYSPPPPVFEKGYPSYEAVNRKETEEKESE